MKREEKAENRIYPLHVFRYQVDFTKVPLDNKAPAGTSSGKKPGGDSDHSGVALCSGAFAECSGLEATMEPKEIKVGGRNYGAAQRSGPVTFSTVILKRGITTTRDMWKWFDLLTRQNKYAYRLSVTITLQDLAGKPTLAFHLARALPVKFKAADLNAKGTDVGVEELHLAHEGLSLEPLV